MFCCLHLLFLTVFLGFMFHQVTTCPSALCFQNYRSHQKILDLPNKLFYNGELQPKADEIITHCMMGWEELPNPQ